MKKNIVIDASSVISVMDGLSQYIVNLIRFLPDDAFEEFNFRLLINKDHNREDLGELLKTGKFEVQEGNIPLIGPKRDWWFYKFLKKYNKTFDLMHVTSTQYPLALKKGVATVHDMTLLYYYYQKNIFYKAAPLYFRQILKSSLTNSRAVIAVSNATKNDLVKYYKLDNKVQEKISVIYEGWEHLEKYGHGKTETGFSDYIFYLGSSRRHKNLGRLIEAFSRARTHLPEKVKLVISGNKNFLHHLDKNLSKEIGSLGDKIFFTGYLTEAEVATFYTNAGCFIFPSLVEGFGIPVLESFYYNTPLLCSGISSLPEVAGEAALFFDPFDTASIAGALTRFYSDKSMAATLAAKGRERLKDFSWKTTSIQTTEVYKRVLAE